MAASNSRPKPETRHIPVNTTTELLPNFLGGKWVSGTGKGVAVLDPFAGAELVRVDASGLDLAAGFSFARNEGGAALRALTYKQRGALLGTVPEVLRTNRDAYYEIATANSGTVKNDSAVDIDGSLFTLGVYAKMGDSLGDRHFLLDGEPARLGKDPLFQSQHVQSPTRGLALFINAFNFPAWGLWEKAAPALLSGVPVIIKPATATAWLTQRMVKDVVDAGVLPAGALSVICGSSAGMLDQLQAFDVLSFTGSAETAAVVRSHPAVTQRSVRVNIEADSLNSALLLPGEAADSESFELLAKEVAREMTVKSGQKCTAIRRIFVTESLYAAAAQAIGARLAKTTVGNPRNETVRMGALVNRTQLDAVREGLDYLKAQTEVLHDGATRALVDADASSCCLGPTLLGARNAAGSDASDRVHDTEVFGPVATLIPYRDLAHALQLVRRGQGSLVCSVYGSDAAALAHAATELADSHGRVHIISPDVAALHTGHGNVMPQSLHGGPGRAGGGEELGGVRALNFYHRRAALQASSAVLAQLTATKPDVATNAIPATAAA
jgi:3,4-dehydroadipyl-CoA semialdehyde dehydrogenase